MSRLFAGPLDDPPLHALEPSTAAASTVCHVRTLTSLLGGLLCNAPRSRRRQALVCCPRNHHFFHFLSYRSVGGCHPERARGTRASEGPAFTGRERRTCCCAALTRSRSFERMSFDRRSFDRRSFDRRSFDRGPPKGCPSHLWESRSFAPAALRMTCSLAFVSPHPLSPSPRRGEGERRTALSSPLSAWRRGGQGVRPEGRGDQRGEDWKGERIKGVRTETAPPHPPTWAAAPPAPAPPAPCRAPRAAAAWPAWGTPPFGTAAPARPHRTRRTRAWRRRTRSRCPRWPHESRR